MDDPTINLSDEDEEMEQQNAPLAYEGSLSKWTNYIHGWQSRWMVLSNGTLSYYKSEHEQGVGCRGAISVFKAVIKPHEFDECRFDVCVGDSVWYLRSNALDDRNRWMEAIERAKCADSAYGSANSLKRHGSALSLTSNTLSGSGVKWCKGLREKVEELETFRDILTRQVDTMQNYFDACISVTDAGRGHGVGHPAWSDSDDDALPTETRGDAAKARKWRARDTGMGVLFGSEPGRCGMQVEAQVHGSPTPSREAFQAQGLDPIDFKGEAITFKATTSGVLSTLQHCAELMAQREDAWRRRMERELERRRQLEELLARQQEAAALAAGAGTPPPSSPASAGSKQRHIMFGGPDYQRDWADRARVVGADRPVPAQGPIASRRGVGCAPGDCGGCRRTATTMGLQKQNSISSFIRKPFKKKKKSKSKQVAESAEPVTANGACSSPPGPVCERCAPLESRVSQLSAELRELRAELAALKGSVSALQSQPPQRAGRHRRDSFESCWDAGSLRFYAAHEEGPHSTIGEDEFFDAVESALDRITEDQEFRDKMRKKQSVKPSEAPKSSQHSLLKEVERVTQQQFKYALAGVDDGVWTIFAEEGEMKMYKREEEVDGLAVDPLKAVHFVSGVTAHEVCHHFWSPDVRLEWETTVEQVTILETVDEQTAINLQVHKRVWPAAQRDSLFWSHIERQVVDGQEYWVVVNNSTDYASERPHWELMIRAAP
ncbi:Collagen type IV alpha-3-binding protein [Amphibalanus amphitrite]|uniref:Collagen type IV alpha-3-binding protein n=1 Tax=Amphibalanus amphitrite TaxID=1232801 RepID=A0A6A4W5G1_AMPAM|nr:Collagen type IV alpha-3-binding protein [Amphibalanus amphitrite]